MTKRYGNVTVLRDVDFDLRRGEIHALLGANGAGKSTLCKMIAGLTEVTAGGMRIEGDGYAPHHKQAAESAGVQIIQQELNLIATLSVAENLLLNRLPSIAGIVSSRTLHRQARAALDRLQLDDVDTHTVVGDLGVGRRQMVEIAAALARECKILILDEPTAALSGSETKLLFDQLSQLRDRGVGMIYISHRLDEVKRIADRVTVLRDGRHVGTEDAESMSTDQMVQRMSGELSEERFGGEIHQRPQPSTALGGDADRRSKSAVLEVQGLCCGMVRDVSFEVLPGETFGIAGLVGSGRTELLRAIFGADRAESGHVCVSGKRPTRFGHPSQAVAAGLAMVTEDRKQNGLLLRQSIRCNTSLSAMVQRFSRFGVITPAREASVAGEMCRAMETRCTSIEQSVGTLSGGNQQKVAIAKWLTRDADVFLFDEPTRGIDVGARRRIYELFEELASAGKGILIVSSDLDELMETCDRIAVMSAGRLVETRERSSWNEDAILQASFAGHRTKESQSLTGT
ncbi:Galactose/methyl galactoside import ATP-binding protein MglA [Stieleria neptunia]|uniref:Galactose/methyl galactoside import ATP-binding protein MglA n=1 Tax=Stieleria neptunia TaxID=2527979 RepID=A0A518HR34_9BACT|nr:sugar ABC transporter ATP-binding protein [Stieleria neptunia]QDV43313.1 Galactose/methyl galactoside import ATP-binding protein MglA [Stieleria neptunia]